MDFKNIHSLRVGWRNWGMATVVLWSVICGGCGGPKVLTETIVVTASTETPEQTGAEETAQTKAPFALRTDDDKINYAVGFEVGRSVDRNKLPFIAEPFFKGLADGMVFDEEGSEPLLTSEERIEVKRNHSKATRAAEKEERKIIGEQNKVEEAVFLAENGERHGVVTTASGLQYEVISIGTGETPTLADKVVAHYTGTLIDGTEFDSSHKRGEPATFSVGRVVKGWTEALQLMRVGAKWRLFIPAKLGYGERGAGSTIQPNSLLIFEIELLEVIRPDEKDNAK